jgi:hypothetical protein
MIPRSLLERIIELLNGLDAERYGYDYCREYGVVLWELKLKMQRLELRNAYAKITSAENEDARIGARIEYLRQKRELECVGVEIY